jgi:Tol biopolymer transport system component
MSRIRGALLAVALCACALPATADAMAPVANGRLAFSAGGNGRSDIVTVKPNGSGWTDLTPGDHPGYCSPAWSPDGTKIAFLEPGDPSTAGIVGTSKLHVMNADGSAVRTLPLARVAALCEAVSWSADGAWLAYLNPGSQVEAIRADGLGPGLAVTDDGSYHHPAWSNDGSRIVYVGEDGHMYTTPVSRVGPALTFGSKQQVDQYGVVGLHPDWSPDDSRLVVERDGEDRGLWTMNSSDGGAAVRLTTDPLDADPSFVDDEASWSPNGRKIAFWRGIFNANGSYLGQGIFTIDADGGAPVQVTGPVGELQGVGQPDWQPLPRGP